MNLILFYFFQPPVPVKPWTETLDCTKDAPMPLSYYMKKQIVGSEDCLYIEISTPTVKPNQLLPVMFWIGSSGFSCNTDNSYDPSLINNQDVLFARCGFRIGPFGFLSMNDFMATGNSGLKDLVLALKWIQNNISAFGGNPNNITIFGNSTGGAAVHLLMLSPMASGLFHKAIIQSASALNNWCVAKNPSRPVMELAKELGITEKLNIDIIEQLRATPALNIMKAFGTLEEKVIKENEYDIFDSIFKPCIEEEFEGQPAFLTKSPPIIIKSGNFNKVPIIIGSNNIEGSVLKFIKENFYSDFEKYNENLSLIVPKSLAGEAKISKSIGQKLLKFYLGGDEFLTKNTRTQYLQLISDYYFLYYVNKTVRLHSHFAPECPIYYYIINYEGEWAMPEDLKFLHSLAHTSEIPFIFPLKRSDFPAFKGSRDSVKTRSRVVKMWTNFAKYG